MAFIVVWSYFNRLLEKDRRYANNFLLVSPNIIVYERLAKDFVNGKIFNELPYIPVHADLIIDSRQDFGMFDGIDEVPMIPGYKLLPARPAFVQFAQLHRQRPAAQRANELDGPIPSKPAA